MYDPFDELPGDAEPVPAAAAEQPPAGAEPVAPAAASPPPAETPASQQRFQRCRWHKPAEGGQPAHCTHREVLPIAGVSGFSHESWCPECTYYKLRRVPRRPPRDY